MSQLGGATLAWQSDYGQFYLADAAAGDHLQAPTDITPEITARSWCIFPQGLAVYTNDCLQQHLRLTIHDSAPPPLPVEPFSGKPWTRIETVQMTFPSKRITLSSPSSRSGGSTGDLGGPFFHLASAACHVRICWMEFPGSRDDSVPIEPDVIDMALWPV